MDNIIVVDSFEYVLENGVYVNKNNDAYYDDLLDWMIAENHIGMDGISKKVGNRYLMKYICVKGMDIKALWQIQKDLSEKSDGEYCGVMAFENGSNYIGGLFDAVQI